MSESPSDQSEFVDSLMVTTAMWADQVRFGENSATVVPMVVEA